MSGRQDQIKPVDSRWVNVRVWQEDEFQYSDHVVNLARSGIPPGRELDELGHDPPLVYVGKVRSI